jgi:hypothetical protein
MPRARARHPFEGDWFHWRDARAGNHRKLNQFAAKPRVAIFLLTTSSEALLLDSFGAGRCLISASIACHG